jgi:hypothetical protein
MTMLCCGVGTWMMSLIVEFSIPHNDWLGGSICFIYSLFMFWGALEFGIQAQRLFKDGR